MHLASTGGIQGRKSITEEDALKEARRVFRPTDEEAENDRRYKESITADGFPEDFQEYLLKNFFYDVEQFLD